MGFFTLGVAGLLYLIFNAQPVSTVVLLPDANGGTGAVVVRAEKGEQALTTAYGSAAVTNRGAIEVKVEDAGAVAQRYAQTLAARPPSPVSFVLFFEFGSAAEISPEFKPVLEQLLSALASYPAPEITVIGHTDRVGTLEFNDRLSLERAETVRSWLVQSGIAPSMIEVAGRGEREPAVPTADEVAQPANRRVEIGLR